MSFDFSQPRNQSSNGLFLIFLQESVKILRAFWPIFIWAFLKTNDVENRWLIILYVVLGIIALTIVHSILWFRSFKFHITDNQFILNKGYLNKKTVSIPLERIQNVQTNQSVFQRGFKVMGVQIDTAGSEKKELKIVSLKEDMAVALSRELSKNLEQIEYEPDTERSESSVPEEKLILKLTNRDLLKIGISQNHLFSALLILIFGNQIFEQVKDLFADKAEQYSDQARDFLGQSGWVIILMIIALFLFAAFLLSMIRTVVLFYNLSFYHSQSGYRIVSGLLNRKNVLLRFNKIQQLNWETGPLKKLFGIYRVNIRQAGSDQSNRKQTIEVPGVLPPHLEKLKNDLFGAHSLENKPRIKIHNRYFIRNWLLIGLGPGLLMSSFIWRDWYYPIAGLAWILIIAGLERLRKKKTGFQISNDQIRTISGAVATRWKQMEFHKVQQIKFTQSFFQRRRKLASLQINNASGFIRIPYVNEQLAKSLHDYLLYYAETSEKSWM